MLESLNGGKPIKESRDVDVPLAAAHFFYYAGWADKLEYAFPNRRPQPAGRRRPDHPLELPAADAGVEDRARPRGGEHRRAQAGRDDAALRAPLLRRAPPGRAAAAASSTSSPATAAPAPRSSTRDVDKIAFTGSTEVGKAIQRAARGQADEADARARRQGRERDLRRRRARPGRRGDRQRHLLQPGPRLLRRLAAVRAGVGASRT